MATPFRADESLDVDGFQKSMRFMAEAGCDGATIVGVLGESNRMTDRERETLIWAAVDAVADCGRPFPICVGTSHAGTAATVALSQMAQELGAAAVMVTPTKEPAPSYHCIPRAGALDAAPLEKRHEALAALAALRAALQPAAPPDEPAPPAPPDMFFAVGDSCRPSAGEHAVAALSMLLFLEPRPLVRRCTRVLEQREVYRLAPHWAAPTDWRVGSDRPLDVLNEALLKARPHKGTLAVAVHKLGLCASSPSLREMVPSSLERVPSSRAHVRLPPRLRDPIRKKRH